MLKRILGALLLLAGANLAIGAEVPLREFFEHSKFKNMLLSPDGKHLAFTYEEGTEVKLAVMDRKNKKITAGFEFGDQMHVQTFFWGNNERVVMAVGKVTGNLDNTGRPSHLYAANIDGSKRRQIFEMQMAGYNVLSRLKDDPEHILIAKYHFADRGKPKPNLLNIYTGELKYLASEPVIHNRYALIADNSGKVRLAAEFIEGATFDDNKLIIHAKDKGDWQQLEIKSARARPNVETLGFSADNRRAYFLSDFDMAENGRMGAFEYDFDSGEFKLLYRHPEVDVFGGMYGHDGDVLGVEVRSGYVEQELFDDKLADGAFLRSLFAGFPGQHASITSYTEDGKMAVAVVRSDRNPAEFYLFDIASRKATFLAAALPNLKPEMLVEMLPVTIPARDGLRLHAMLTRPRGQDKNLPLIVNVHGGPFGVTDFWGFDPEAQFFASRGYATLQVNYRGSGNRGADFMDLGRRGWGKVMQDDVTDATRWAVKVGVADPERICIYGGSYGGYATLAGVIKEPDLYKCGVGYVGVYDMPWFRKGDGSDADRGGSEQKAAMDKWMSAYVGDDESALREVSPVHNVDKIKAALFLVHGSNDVRVPVGHYERLIKALDKISYPYKSMLKPEGHGFYQVENRVALYSEMLEFFDQHIGDKRQLSSAD